MIRIKNSHGLPAGALLLLGLLALAGCPKPPAGGTAGTGSTDSATSQADSTGQPGGRADEGLKALDAGPSVADYISGSAGTEVVTTADGQSMPQGWLLPQLLPPAGSRLLEGAVSRQPWASGAVQWLQPFTTDSGWPAVQAAAEDVLRPAGFKLVRGEKTPVEPQLDADGRPAVGYTKAERSYRSADGRTLVFLRGELRRVAERPQDPPASFELQIVFFDEALPLPGATSLEDF